MIKSILCQAVLCHSLMFFYTGSYTQKGAPAVNPHGKGIGCFQFDSEKGTITNVNYTSLRNVSYLTVSSDSKYLYAVEELAETEYPKVYAYQIKKDGNLNLLNSQKLIGDYACHLSIVDGRLMVANYGTGNALSFPILKDGFLGSCEQIIQHKGVGPNKERQEAAHAHMVYPFDHNKVFVVDLGLDKATAYVHDASNQWIASKAEDISVDPGAGSRHMTMDKTQTYAYLLGELDGHIYVVKKEKDGFQRVQKISFVPRSYHGDFGGAAIRIHPNGKYLYATCRGANTIAVFSINENTGILSLVHTISSFGTSPRDFNIDPSGKWLIVANQDSDSLVVFKIDSDNGMLEKHESFHVDTPVNISWK